MRTAGAKQNETTSHNESNSAPKQLDKSKARAILPSQKSIAAAHKIQYAAYKN